MHLFDVNGQIRKYPSALAILQTYFPVRLSFYVQRRTALLAQLQQQRTRLTNKSRFIQLVTAGAVHIVNTGRSELLHALAQHGLVDGVEQLLDMRVSAFSAEEVQRLEAERLKCEAEVRRVEGLTAERMWEADLDRLEARIEKLLDTTAEQQADTSSKRMDSSQRRDEQAVKRAAKKAGNGRGGGERETADKAAVSKTRRHASKQLL